MCGFTRPQVANYNCFAGDVLQNQKFIHLFKREFVTNIFWPKNSSIRPRVCNRISSTSGIFNMTEFFSDDSHSNLT